MVDELTARIQQALDQSDRKRKVLAKEVGVSAETLSRWTKGTRKPTRENIERLAAALQKPVGWFYPAQEVSAEEGERLDTVGALGSALEAFRIAVLAGGQPDVAWEQVMGRADALTEEQRSLVMSDPAGLRAYFAGPEGGDWVRLSDEKRRVVRDLIRLLAQSEAPDR